MPTLAAHPAPSHTHTHPSSSTWRSRVPGELAVRTGFLMARLTSLSLKQRVKPHAWQHCQTSAGGNKQRKPQLCKPLAVVLLGASADQQTPRKHPRAAEASRAPRRPLGGGEAAHTGAEEPDEGPKPATGPAKIQGREEFNTAGTPEALPIHTQTHQHRAETSVMQGSKHNF